MTTLIPILERDGEQAVSGRELHAFLEVGAEYRHWFPRMAEYGFIEGEDYAVISDRVARDGRGYVSRTDHALTLDAAKEIAMIQRTEKGKQARAYFIEVEKRYRAGAQLALPQSYAEALRAHADEVERRQVLEAKAKADAPKVLFADSVSASGDVILVAQLANVLKQNGIDIGQNRLFERLRAEGYLCSAPGQRNRPTQRSMDMGLFEVSETTIQGSDGTPRLRFTPKVTGKGQQYFINRYSRQEVSA